MYITYYKIEFEYYYNTNDNCNNIIISELICEKTTGPTKNEYRKKIFICSF